MSKLPLAFSLKSGPLFTLYCTGWELAPEEALTVNITMDPSSKSDLQSLTARQRLQVTYSDNPQKDGVDLVADMQFPNLRLETQSVEFGSVLTDTTKWCSVTATNTSNAVVEYSWVFIKEEVDLGACACTCACVCCCWQARPQAWAPDHTTHLAVHSSCQGFLPCWRSASRLQAGVQAEYVKLPPVAWPWWHSWMPATMAMLQQPA